MKKVVDFGNGFGMIIHNNDRFVVDYLDEIEVNVPDTDIDINSNLEEFRLFISQIDDNSGELIKNFATKYSKRWNLDYRTSYLLMGLVWAQNWKPLMRFVNFPPLELEKWVKVAIGPLLLQMIEEKILLGEISPEEGEELKEEIKDPYAPIPDQLLREFFIYCRLRNFTGEVRLKEEEEEEKFSPSPEEEKEEKEILRLIQSIVTATRGGYAYKFSKEALALISGLPKEKKGRFRKLLNKALEIRKSLPSSASLEERIEASRRIFV
jgi:hypothetical protein